MNMPKSRDIQVKIPPGRIALRRRGIMSLKRPVAGGESCKQDSFLWILTCNCEGTEQLQKPANKKSSVFLKKISKIRFDILCITFKPPEMPALKVVI